MEKQVIVTGGAGYIGSHTVVELMAAGFTPIIIDDFRNSEAFILDRIEEITGNHPLCYQIDCSDETEILKVFEKHSKAVGVIHFAAYKAVGESVQYPQKYFDNNVGSMKAVLHAMKQVGIDHLVFSSSCTVYGEPAHPEVTEETPIQKATSPYGETKILCEQLIQQEVDEASPIKATVLRYFNPIGAHPSARIGELPQGIPNNLLPFITQTAQGIREELVVFGDDYDTVDGTNVRDYIHVVDLAKAHLAALNWSLDKTTAFCEPFNLGTGKGSSVLEIIHTFEEVNNLKLNYRIGERRDGDVVQIYANAEKAKTILGWECELTIAEALRDSWAWEKGLHA